MGIALLFGCRRAAPPPAPMIAVEAEDAGPPPAGVVTGSVFHDQQLGLTLRLPTSWTPTVGAMDGALRLRAVSDRAPETILEVWRRPAGTTAPFPRAECTWTFIDAGPHLGLPGTEELTLATCTPEAPADPRIYAWITERGDDLWQFEITAPWPRLLDAHREGEAVLSTVRWGDRPN